MRRIVHNDKLIAIVIEHSFYAPGITFFTPQECPQQLGCLTHAKGHLIAPHAHNCVERTITETTEVLIIKKGVLRADLYDDNQVKIESVVLRAGDLILLASGGHGFEVLDDVEMIEVKQGPYLGDKDKYRFDPGTKPLP